MAQDKTPLGIILAIEKASDEQLAVLSRIEQALINPITPPESSPQPDNQVTVSAPRRTRRKATSTVSVDSQSQASRDLDIQRDKYRVPAHRQKEPVTLYQGEFTPTTGHPTASQGEPNILRSERAYKSEVTSGIDHARTLSAGATNVETLIKSVNALNGTIAGQTADIVRIDKNGRKRDGNGRFLSKKKADELNQKRANANSDQGSDAMLKKGFLSVLGSALSNSGQSGHAGAGDLAGAATGGVMWQMARGAWDVGVSAKDTAVSINDFRKKHHKSTAKEGADAKDDRQDEGGSSLQTKGSLALKPAITYPNVDPKEDGSQAIFSEAASTAQLKAIEKQTAELSGKDDTIIKNQEDELDLLKKIANSHASNDPLGRGLLDRLFGRNKNVRRGRSRKEKGERKRITENSKSKKSPLGSESEHEGSKHNRPGDDVDKAKPNEEAGKSKGKAPAANDDNAKSQAKSARENPVKNGGKVTRVGEAEAVAKLGGSVPKAVMADAANDVIGAGEKKGVGALAKGAIKGAGSVALKTGLKAIPILGTALGVGWDAMDGYNDTEGQKKAFDLPEGQEASGRQKTEMSAASVATMGGLIPMASQGLSWAADKAGMHGTAKALDFDTSDVAGAMDKGVTAISSAASDAIGTVSEWFTNDNKTKNDVKDAVKDGSDKTVGAINRLTEQLEGGKFGEDGIGSTGAKATDYNAPTVDAFTMGPNGLNIGGKNAANRNFRNNNFGNLNFANQDGAVLEDTPGKGSARFARFNTPEEGMRALANQVSSYAHGTSKAAGYQKLTSVKDIIGKWAPANENDTGKYIDTISGTLGVKSTDSINTDDPKVMTKLIRAISTYEGGNPTVSDGTIQNSIGQYDDKAKRWVGGKFTKATQAELDKKADAKGEAHVANDSLVSIGKDVVTTGAVAKAAVAKQAGTTEQAKPGKPADAANDPQAAPAVEKKGIKTVIAKAVAKATMAAGAMKAMTSNIPDVSSVLSGIQSSSVLAAMAEKSKQADGALTSGMEKITGEHVGFKRATSELSLPGGGESVPEGLRTAMLPPSEIGKAQTRNARGAVTAAPTPPQATGQDADGVPIVPESQINHPVEINPLTGKPAGLMATAKTPQTADTGFFAKTGGFLSEVADNALKAAPDVLSSIGSIAMPMAQQVLGGAASGLGSQLSDSIGSPFLSALANPLIDQGVSSVNSAIQQPQQVTSMFSMPQVMPAVTDLARSGTQAALSQAPQQAGDAVAKALNQLVDLTKKLVSGQKDKGSSRPDVVVNGGQKAPKRDDKFNDSALDALMED